MLLSSVRRRISWNKGYHGYRQDIKGCHRVTFYSNSCSDTDNREELWEAEMEGPPDSLFLLLIFSAPGWCNEIPWQFLESLPLSWKHQPTEGPRLPTLIFELEWAAPSKLERGWLQSGSLTPGTAGQQAGLSHQIVQMSMWLSLLDATYRATKKAKYNNA